MIFFTKEVNCTMPLRAEFDMGIDITGYHKHGIQRFDSLKEHQRTMTFPTVLKVSDLVSPLISMKEILFWLCAKI